MHLVWLNFAAYAVIVQPCPENVNPAVEVPTRVAVIGNK
jgi:hypothetical protein